MSVKCEETIDERLVTVASPKLKKMDLVSGME